MLTRLGMRKCEWKMSYLMHQASWGLIQYQEMSAPPTFVVLGTCTTDACESKRRGGHFNVGEKNEAIQLLASVPMAGLSDRQQAIETALLLVHRARW